MKFLTFICCFLAFSHFSPDLSEIRKNYPSANNSKEVTQNIYEALSTVTKDDKAVLVAYKGGIATLMAKHSKKIKEKKSFFQEGVALLEHALARESDNIEIRYIRLGVQENAPGFLKYKSNIETDKQFILEQFSEGTPQEIRGLIKDYIQRSPSFTTAEKQLF